MINPTITQNRKFPTAPQQYSTVGSSLEKASLPVGELVSLACKLELEVASLRLYAILQIFSYSRQTKPVSHETG